MHGILYHPGSNCRKHINEVILIEFPRMFITSQSHVTISSLIIPFLTKLKIQLFRNFSKFYIFRINSYKFGL